MPNTKSAKKRLKQNQNQRSRNRAIRSNLRTHIRKVRAAVAAGNIEEAEQVFRLAAQRLDRAAGRSLIHKNHAARLKSRLQKLIKTAKQNA